MWDKIQKFYLQIITNASVKIAVLEICFEKTEKSVVGVHCWYIKKYFCKTLATNLGKKKSISEDILAALCFYLNSTFISKSSSPLLRCKSYIIPAYDLSW